MNDKSKKEIPANSKWRMLRTSVLSGLLGFAIMFGCAMLKAPQIGQAIERLPPLSGVYKCCSSGGRYSQSWIGTTEIYCLGFSYYPLGGTGRNDCGHKETLDGQQVEVVRVVTPSLWPHSPVVAKITTANQIVRDKSDLQIRELWISGTLFDSLQNALWIFLIIQLIQLIRNDRNTKRNNN